ncbi:MAG: hypothetical protein WC867_04005 [Candidatus Pacearchaeota archaeon]|jgi:hypothetical protein
MRKYLQNITLATGLALASLPNISYADSVQKPLYIYRAPREIKKYENIELEIIIPEEEFEGDDCIKPFNIKEDIKRIYQKFRILLDRNREPTPAGNNLEKRLR